MKDELIKKENLTKEEQEEKSLLFKRLFGEGFIQGKAGVKYNPFIKRNDPYRIFTESNQDNED